MLKNLKVGTKLFAILVPPVLVLLYLASVGVRDRLDTSAAATRVGELTSFAEKDMDFMYALQVEGVYSAQYMASKKEAGKAELDAARTKTDAALSAYKDAVRDFRPEEVGATVGSDKNEVKDELSRVDNRIKSLTTNRKSVDELQTDPDLAIEQYGSITNELMKLNNLIALNIEEPTLARTFLASASLQESVEARGQEAMYLTAVAQIGMVPTKSQWGSSKTETDGTVTKTDPVPCNDLNSSDQCPLYAKIIELNFKADSALDTFTSRSTVDQKTLVRDLTANAKFTTHYSNNFFDPSTSQIKAGQKSDLPQLKTDRAAVTKDSVDLLGIYRSALIDPNKSLNKELKDGAASLKNDADTSARLYAVGAIGAILAAFILAFLVYRATTVPLKKLTSAAYTLSTERLPGLVERLRNPEEAEGQSLAETLTPIDISSKDEIGQLADAFNSIQHVTVEVAEEQAQLLRKGIGDIFINLARRNQTLLDRQIEFIDQLEANEEDPDQLDNLFKLDHLATRMRRNAESLLVLAGAEPPRRRGRPVALADVVRVAIGEVEDFARIQLLALDDATVGGNVAVDLAHLLSELMENATHFSPPDTMVEVVGHRADDGSYIISVSDQGIGMSADQLSEANVQLANPPLVGLALSRSLGFIVIGRLAQRFAISVKLTASPSGGVTALVTLPDDLVTYEGEPPRPAPAAESAPQADAEPVFAPEEPAIVLEDEVVVLDEPAADEELEEELVGADDGDDLDMLDELGGDLLDELVEVPEGEDFDEGLRTMVEEEMADAPVEPAVEMAAEPEPVAEAPAVNTTGKTVAEQIAAASRAEAKVAELTASGLVRRTPKQRSSAGGPGSATVPTKSAGQSTRSPEEVRKMLSRYRAGMNRGRDEVNADKTDS